MMSLPYPSSEVSPSLWRRRSILQAGLAGGMSLPGLFQAHASAAGVSDSAGFGRAKRCIFLFMWGGPSHIDTLDPKPHAPAEVRGEFGTIETNVPGISLSEHFQQTARQCDKLAIVRSLSHSDPSHLASGHCSLTGHLAPVPNSDAEPPSDRDTPHIGSVLSKFRHQQTSLPNFVTMPWKAFHPAAPGGQAPGQTGGWLGKQYDPLLIEGDPAQPNWKVPSLSLSDGIDPNRLTARRQLLSSIDAQRRSLEQFANVQSVNAQQQTAFGLLTSPDVRRAFELGAEPDAVRDRYGRNTHGQCVLLARRLVEAGVSLVSVNWHNDGQNFWDTHGNNFPRLKNDLIPPADRALSALLEDLSQRGLLDETLVCWVGEFGRTPRAENGGRQHYPQCYSGIFAGGGVRGGQLYGRSDDHATFPAENPVTPGDYAATVLHAMGVPHDLALLDQSNRPHRVYGGAPLVDLFG
ncbi:MAG TPA: DUF1501 domain-containing protein [Planctomycetaceae bacterium]|nr:DUF1501 domain-containing protein [Planctomycetaceae bacterium]